MRTFITLCLSLLFLTIHSQAQTPRALRPDIKISLVTKVQAEATRIAINPIDSALYYSTANGNVYKVINPATGPAHDTLIYSVTDHHVQYVQGLVFHDSILYVSGNNDPYSPRTTGIIVRGRMSAGYSRNWDTVARTVPYPIAGWYDHYFSGITLNPTNDTLLICSGSRGDHGEVNTNGGLYPGLRNLPITTIILRIPASANDLILPNDADSLDAKGLLFCSGVRNTYDFAYNSSGDLFGVENSCDRDMEDELNYLQQGKHYGFPWMMGGSYNPQQFPTYDPNADSLINRLAWGWTIGSFHNDPTFPQKPAGLQMNLPCRNYGPDAAFMRDSVTGKTYDAAKAGDPVYSFTPHRCPLGLTFDRDSILGGNYRGAGFVVSYTRGNPSLPDSSVMLIPFKDTSEDLLMLVMEKNATKDNYSFHAYKIADHFNRPVDAVFLDTCMYVIETGYSGQESVWKIDFPRYVKPIVSVSTSKGNTDAFAYPNPVDGMLHISVGHLKDKKVALKILDATGKLVYSEMKDHQQQIRVNTSSFTPGIYSWQIDGETVYQNGTFVVVHQ